MPAVYVSSGSVIPADSGCLVGHGCQLTSAAPSDSASAHNASDLLVDDDLTPSQGTVLRSTVSGFITRINALISVRPLHSRYSPEIGDVVVARVLSVADQRWSMDIQSRRSAILLLSSINLPENEQRKRTTQDRLQMRNFYKEADLVCCEVQAVRADGAAQLHTRSNRYRKLTDGQYVYVHSSLIRRCAGSLSTTPHTR